MILSPKNSQTKKTIEEKAVVRASLEVLALEFYSSRNGFADLVRSADEPR